MVIKENYYTHEISKLEKSIKEKDKEIEDKGMTENEYLEMANQFQETYTNKCNESESWRYQCISKTQTIVHRDNEIEQLKKEIKEWREHTKHLKKELSKMTKNNKNNIRKNKKLRQEVKKGQYPIHYFEMGSCGYEQIYLPKTDEWISDPEDEMISEDEAIRHLKILQEMTYNPLGEDTDRIDMMIKKYEEYLETI